MSYQEDRRRRLEIFEDTMLFCERQPQLVAAIEDSRAGTVLYREPLAQLELPEVRYTMPCGITVSKQRTLAAAWELRHRCPEGRIGILHFASPLHPGGGVLYGGSAQEECLCRCSTLYPCLDTPFLQREYYTPHSAVGPGGSDAVIYIPDIIGIKTDSQWPEPIPETEYLRVDVISCAPPYYEKPKVGGAKGKETAPNRQERQTRLERRIRGILQVAASHDVELLVLGSYGCGVHQEDPMVVAQTFHRVLEEYRYLFRQVEFAVYASSREHHNFDVFSAVFAGGR
jgi:uncharacterized protein (TIGR02452 family)